MEYGLPVRSATIEKSPGCIFDAGSDLFKAASVHAAGEMAEVIVIRKTAKNLSETDWEEMSKLGDLMHVHDKKQWCLQASKAAAKVLMHKMDEIEELAKALEQKKTLDADELLSFSKSA